jgi:hypothetical protein
MGRNKELQSIGNIYIVCHNFTITEVNLPMPYVPVNYDKNIDGLEMGSITKITKSGVTNV